jgi:transposase
MRVRALVPHLAGLHVGPVQLCDGQLTLDVSARRRTARCPLCHARCQRVHSRYRRHPEDLPINGLRVTLWRGIPSATSCPSSGMRWQ